ncbi:holo-[acyl-carrier-protein] synthase [Sulfurivirga caldicuralii]|uniref:Holo-[acyl-carrier-protein] synthase n=2 Tax=Sulfurivirga caldicuralii TaxID=364032 RepID=A0A1N6EJV1_9GAMM|nr:holo-[acyl-carrier-protein] synthase [Sulfurivirga caldicuralii]
MKSSFEGFFVFGRHMILGIGSDMVEVARIAALQQKHPTFAQRILCEQEYAQWQSRKACVAFLAKRWAAKEAVFKALGTGLRDGMRFQQVCIENDALGKPEVCLHGAAAQRAAQMGIRVIHLSLSDERNFALAFAVAEGDLTGTV